MKSTRRQSLWLGIGLMFLFAMVALPLYGAAVIHPIVPPYTRFSTENLVTASEPAFFGFEFGFLGWDGSTSNKIEPQMESA